MPIRPWVQTPRDKSLSDQTNDFLVWVMKALSEIQGAPTPPPAPTVSTSVSGNAVTLTWNEIQGSAGYIVYENTTAVLPPKPVAAVQSLGSQAVRSGLQNSYRIIAQPAGTFYYFVQAITANGIAGAVSTVQKAVVSAVGGPPPAGAANANDHFVSWATDADLPNQDVLPFGLVMGEGDGTKPHAIPSGTAGQVLISNGPGVDPAFMDPIVSGATPPGSVPSTNPVLVAGAELCSGKVRTIQTSPKGAVGTFAHYQIADEDSTLLVKYFGFTSICDKGTWYILKQDTTTSPYSYRYANVSNNQTRTDYGAAGATGAWANRAALTYDYIYNLTGL